MRWWGVAALSVAGVIAGVEFREQREAIQPPAAAALALPTRLTPPRDVRGDAAVMRLALSAGFSAARGGEVASRPDALREPALRDELALASPASITSAAPVPEAPLAALGACAGLFAAAARLRACRQRQQ